MNEIGTVVCYKYPKISKLSKQTQVHATPLPQRKHMSEAQLSGCPRMTKKMSSDPPAQVLNKPTLWRQLETSDQPAN